MFLETFGANLFEASLFTELAAPSFLTGFLTLKIVEKLSLSGNLSLAVAVQIAILALEFDFVLAFKSETKNVELD